MKEFDLKEYLDAYKNRKVDFFRFPGNYGDSLIWHGTMALLSSLNISVEYVDVAAPINNATLLIDGGGNFVDYYSDVRDFLIKKTGLYDEIIMLPHTIFGEKQVETLNNLSSKLVIFCRERVSTDFVEKRLTHGEAYLWHDCAFNNQFPQTHGGEGILNAFRRDKESAVHKLPPSNIDVSYKGYATKPLKELTDVIQRYRQVNTDRLHLAIAATLLGKQVRLYPNSYYKNRAVFDYSLKKYPNIRFVEKLE